MLAASNAAIQQTGGRRMKRRDFLKAGGAGLASTAIAAPAIAQSMPELKWRLTSSFPKSLDTLYGGSEIFVKAIAEATDNKFQIQCFAAGEIVPGLQALDAVSNGTVEMCATAPYYYAGKDPTFTFGTALPFGLNARMQLAWQRFGGGMELMNELYKKFNVYGIPAGNTGAQMGGFFRKELNTVDDLRGLKMRIGGVVAGRVMAKLGVVPQQLAGGDIYPALEKGTIDAAEWVGPYDDEKLGFHKVAKYMHIPGVLELCANTGLYINKAAWAALPVSYQTMLRAACTYALMEMLAGYDAKNAKALARVVAAARRSSCSRRKRCAHCAPRSS